MVYANIQHTYCVYVSQTLIFVAMMHCTFQVLWLTTMPTLAEVLVQFSWMTCCVLGLRQGLWTVPMTVLETMTIAIAFMVMMQEYDASQV